MNIIEIFTTKIEAQNLWGKQLTFDRNEYVKVEGSINTNVYYVLSGSLRLFVLDEYEEHTIRFSYENEFAVALDSFISGQASDLYIQAIKKTELKVMSKEKFMQFVESSIENLQLWNHILSHLIFQQMERERDLLTSSPVERYRRVLERSPQLFQKVPNKYIASYLRMTPETLSRIKKA